MKLGLSISSTHSDVDGATGARRMIERARAANDLGLDTLSLGDHHAMPYNYFQNGPMLGRILPEWDTTRPAGCLFLLPIWNPVLVAEHVGTLACLLDAPFILQTGIGGGEQQFNAMGAHLSRRGRDLDESVRFIKALLAGETAESERFGLSDAQVNPLPPQPVEWWIGAGAGKPIDRAAREGDVWYAGPHVTAADAPELLAQYVEACDQYGRSPRPIVRKDFLVLRDGDRATQIGHELINTGYRGMSRSSVAYGGVDQVVDQLSAFKELGFEQVVARCMAPDQADALETLELLGEVRRQLA